MESFINNFENIITTVAYIAIYVLELMGIIIVIWTGINGFIRWLRRNRRTRIYLGRGFTMALLFKLGREILRMVIVQDMYEIAFVAAIIGLHFILTYTLNWEIKNEEDRHRSLVPPSAAKNEPTV